MLRSSLLAALALALPFTGWAHPELVAQIEAVSARIEVDPGNPELYLQRGNLHRRHRDWKAGASDFHHARRLAPGDAEVDWYEGHLWLDAGVYERAEMLLTRYLDSGADNPVAYQHRAQARLALGRGLDAARDFERTVAASQAPGPELYRFWSLALVTAGGAHLEDALDVTRAGLRRAPGDPSLRGLATDLALASGATGTAAGFTRELHPSVAALPQWRFRSGLLACLDGHPEQAGERLRGIVAPDPGHPATRKGTWHIAPQAAATLRAGLSTDTCGAAARAQLEFLAAEVR